MSRFRSMATRRCDMPRCSSSAMMLNPSGISRRSPLMVTVIPRLLRARAHCETNLVLVGIRPGVNHQRQIALSQWRQWKPDSHAALIVAGASVTRHFGGAFDSGFYLGARERLPVGPPHDFDVELHVAALQPRSWIQKLHLNPARACSKFQRSGDLLRKRTFAK